MKQQHIYTLLFPFLLSIISNLSRFDSNFGIYLHTNNRTVKSILHNKKDGFGILCHAETAEVIIERWKSRIITSLEIAKTNEMIITEISAEQFKH